MLDRCVNRTHSGVIKLHVLNEKDLTLQDLSPRWQSRLKERRSLPFPLSIEWFKWYAEIRNSSKCIVGEAYGYSSSYLNTCKQCNKICVKFMNYFMIHSRSGLEKNATLFVRHWNEEHAKVEN